MEEFAFDGVLEVSQLNEYVASLLAADPMLRRFRVQGEISGFKRHTSGHLYFSLKDERALVRCVMFRSQAMELDFRPQDGMQVVLTGYASLYARDGAFQLYAQSLEKLGAGELYLQFLQLKARLEQEGYFDPDHKKTIPFLPKSVGVVTSGTGAAVQDVLSVIGRRFPKMSVVLAPVKVQGTGAAEEIAAAIDEMNRKDAAEVIILCRGGGSMEDLWPFNEMPVIQSVYNSRIPIVSGVGHETDFTIADFVADLRAPTPSAAAELVVPEWNACVEAVLDYQRRLGYGLKTTVTHERSRVQILAASHGFRMPMERVFAGRQQVDAAKEVMDRAVLEPIRLERERLAAFSQRLAALNPLEVLGRGYAVLRDPTGKTVTSVKGLQTGQQVRLTLHDGSADATIDDILREGDTGIGKNGNG